MTNYKPYNEAIEAIAKHVIDNEPHILEDDVDWDDWCDYLRNDVWDAVRRIKNGSCA